MSLALLRPFSSVGGAAAHAGQIQLIVGPMFAGKSTEMLRRVRRFELAAKRVLTVKYRHDTRYDDSAGGSHAAIDDSVAHIATHDSPQAMIASAVEQQLANLVPRLPEYDIVGIDEGQFFPDLAEFCDLAAGAGKTVIVAALDGTFERKPFATTSALLPLAEDVTKLTAVCSDCGASAPFTWRSGELMEVEVIGGSELYTPVCRQHYAERLERKRAKT
eukprot:g7965.t1